MKISDVKNNIDAKEFEVFTSIPGVNNLFPDTECYLRENGNYKIIYLKDGSKLRFSVENSLDPEMPECIDMNISTLCDGGCEYCYLNCGPNGKFADFSEGSDVYRLLDEIPPYTELAINMNNISMLSLQQYHDFMYFLEHMKKRNVFVNVTVSQKHFKDDCFRSLLVLKERELIQGIGISYIDKNDKMIERINAIESRYGQCIVMHVIAGIIDESDWEYLEDNHLSILVLGYKEIGRGINYADTRADEINDKIYVLKSMLRKRFVEKSIKSGCRSVAFDGLAIEQMMIREWFTDEQFDDLYAGDEGAYTFYLDLVNKRYGISSIESITYEIGNKSIKEMFDSIRVPGLKSKE